MGIRMSMTIHVVIVVLGFMLRMDAMGRTEFLTDRQRGGRADHCFLSAHKKTALSQAVGQMLDEWCCHAHDRSALYAVAEG